jgi:uncharacterized membrane protein YkoI
MSTPKKEGSPMTRTRTAAVAGVLILATAGAGVAIASGDDAERDADGPAALTDDARDGRTTVADDRDGAPATRTVTGDDGLTHAQAVRARRAALARVPGRVVAVERDADDGRVTYDLGVLTRGGQAREVVLDSRFRVRRTTSDDRDGLTYATAGRAADAATKRVRGAVTGVDVEDDGPGRYEVEVLTPAKGERIVALSSSFRVLSVRTDDD